MDIIQCIKERRSVRSYTEQNVEQALIQKIIEGAIWAPSGKNRQPWKLKIIMDTDLINNIAIISKYSKWIKHATCFVFVFLDKEISYDYVKDVQSCGAFIQTMLLCAKSYGIGSCWVGEIINESKIIMEILGLSNYNIELMALVTLGYNSKHTQKSTRKNINEFIL